MKFYLSIHKTLVTCSAFINKKNQKCPTPHKIYNEIIKCYPSYYVS